MIEWVVLVLAGAAALSKTGKKESPGGRASGNRVPAPTPFGTQKSGEADFREKVAAWRALWEPAIDRKRWIPSGTAARIVAKYPPPERPRTWLDSVLNRNSILDDLKAEFDAHNENHLATQQKLLKPFFDRVERNPLTDEQIKACICMDDCVQIVAAAGSGKTSTMVAKAGYALHEGLAGPDEILLLAFNRDAAEELGTRIRDRLKNIPDIEQVTARTFHSFGLDVIAAAAGRKPSLAPWVEQPGQDVDMILKIIDELSERDADFRRKWNLFRTVFGRDIGSWSEPAQPDAFGNGRRGFRTANGEIVKSREECLIADWLFYHHVPYEYEPEYEHETATESHRQYRPDFYYPDIALYHEHFALNRQGMPPPHFAGDYLAGVAWKRQLHAEKGTNLIETRSFEISSGIALTRLEAELKKRGVTVRFDPDREPAGSKPVSSRELASTLRVFQQHVKNNGLSSAQLHEGLAKHSQDGHAARLSMFVALYERISDEWERRLREGRWIDFEDMLIMAAGHVESGGFKSPYTIVLSDEFQDSSRTRIRLLEALRKSSDKPVHLCVVGDDWQGINRFAGADISVMNEFEQIFPHATRLTLNTTFRCPQSLCDASSAFIQKNPAQIRKAVKTTNSYAKQSLIAFGFQDLEKSADHLADQLDQMHRYVKAGKLKPEGGQRIRVLILGRYRNDRPGRLQQWQKKFGDALEIDFRTVHSSKGLEADYVMLINLVEGARGFPSQIEDDPVLQIPMPSPDPFPMAEERRLFYVGLTRARRQTRIYTSLTQPSRFLVELMKAGALVIEPVDGEPLEACPQCESGVLKLRKGKFGDFEACTKCDFKRNAMIEGSANSATPVRLREPVSPGSVCPTCQLGSMVVLRGKFGEFLGCSAFPDCKTTAPMPR